MLGRGTTFLELSTFDLANFDIAIPDFFEQQAIADYLDRKCSLIDSTIEKQKAVIEKLKLYKQSVITEAVTKGLDPNVNMKPSGIEWIGEIPKHWRISKLKYLGSFINGYAFPSTSFTSIGVRVIKISNIQTMNIDWSDESYVEEDYYKNLPQFRVNKGDLVFALTRPIISSGIKAAIVDNEDRILLNQRNALFRGGDLILPLWMYYIMLNGLFVQEFESHIDRTGQQPNISSIDIGNLPIPIPEISEQRTILEYLGLKCTQIDTIITRKQKLIEKLTNYKKSLIYECVTGKREVV